MITDAEIKELIQRSKFIRRQDVSKLSGNEKNLEGAYWRFSVNIQADGDDSFTLIGRCAVDDPSDFSAILAVDPANGDRFLLLRCNGGSHQHRNYIEKTRIRGTHIHIATQRYIDCGRKAEDYAEATDAYSDFEGAVNHLMKLAHISIEPNVNEPRDQLKIF